MAPKRQSRRRPAAAPQAVPEPTDAEARSLLSEDLRDNPRSLAWAKAELKSRAYQREFRHVVMDFYSAHTMCPRTACRRARRCVPLEAPCYDEALPSLEKYVFPGLRKAIKANWSGGVRRRNRLPDE